MQQQIPLMLHFSMKNEGVDRADVAGTLPELIDLLHGSTLLLLSVPWFHLAAACR